jgi:tetratricopeptide (TPR) repeat protein
MSCHKRILCCLGAALLLSCAGAAGFLQPPAANPPAPNPPPATAPAALDVGSPAPPIRAAAWLNGKSVQIERRPDSPVLVLTFFDPSSGPCRAVLPALSALQDRDRQRGLICIGVTDEATREVQRFLEYVRPQVSFRIAIDDRGATTAAYCGAIGINFLPYSFIIARNGTIAWHGHPQQPELEQYVEQLLSGKYNQAQAREAVHRALGVEQLETVFREAYANQSWRTALLALNQLLDTNAPKDRLLRYKLEIVLGEQRDQNAARALVAQILKDYPANARLLNSLAWDVVSTDRLYLQDPEIGLQLAQAAYHASGGQDPAILDTYARALHLLGRIDLAIAVEEKAVRLGKDPDRQLFEQRLTFYRRCQNLQGGLHAEPQDGPGGVHAAPP